MKLAVCLPTRNEEESIVSMVEAIRALGMEVFVVDAASTDQTLALAEGLGVEVFQRNGLGKGYGMQKALQVATERGYHRLAFIDCDMSYPVNALPELVALSQDYDMVMGVRNMRDVQFTHALANRFFNTMVNILFGGSYTDINTGMRVLHVAKFAPILDAPNFDIEAQISCQALKHRFSIKQVPIAYHSRRGTSKVRLADAFEVFFRIIKERL